MRIFALPLHFSPRALPALVMIRPLVYLAVLTSLCSSLFPPFSSNARAQSAASDARKSGDSDTPGGVGLALAQGLSAVRIIDCQGFTRAVNEVGPGNLSRVEVVVSPQTVAAASAPIEIQLTEVTTGVTRVSTVENGVATFENIPAGIFEVSPLGENVLVGVISIGNMAFEAAVLTGVGAITGLAATGAVVGAVVAIDDAVDSGSSGGGPPNPPNPPGPEPTPPPVVTPRPPQDCATCDPTASPPALDQDDLIPAERVELSPYR